MKPDRIGFSAWSRRRFLSVCALASVYGMLGSCARAATPRGSRVVVIGAGAAGISAGYDLKKAGFEVIVLEGRDRIGGRVWTNRDLGFPVDLGASWIHGTSGNPLVRIASDLGIVTRPTDYDNIRVFDFDGKPISEREAGEIQEGLATLLAEVESYAGTLGSDISVGAAIREVLKGETLTKRERRALNWSLSTLETAQAADLDWVSLFGEDRGLGGGDVLFPDGYDQIFREAVAELDIRTGHLVKHVSRNESGVRVETTAGTFEAEAAVVTLPLGVLKRGSVRFSPALPDFKTGAIRRLGVGELNKFAMVFPERFWPAEPQFLGYISKTKGEYPVFMNWHHYAGRPALMAFTGGSFARASESRSDEAVEGELMRVLRTIFGARIPDPEAGVRTRWHSDPFAGGSYSHIAVGATGADFDALAEPVGRIFFAGEATIRDYPATVHGAMLSGIREAERIANLYG